MGLLKNDRSNVMFFKKVKTHEPQAIANYFHKTSDQEFIIVIRIFAYIFQKSYAFEDKNTETG
jgi:hypothetical protein